MFTTSFNLHSKVYLTALLMLDFNLSKIVTNMAVILCTGSSYQYLDVF